MSRPAACSDSGSDGQNYTRLGDFIERLKNLGASTVKVGDMVVHFGTPPLAAPISKRLTDQEILERST